MFPFDSVPVLTSIYALITSSMSNTHKQSKGYPHHASSGLSNTPSGVQPNHQYSTPSNKATYFEGSSAYGGSSDDTLPLTPTSKTTSAAQSTPHHQTIQGNPTSHHKATSTSDEVKKDSVPSGAKIGDDADAGSGSTVTSAYLKSEGADSTLQDAGKSEAQAKYPLPKRSATPSDLSAEERPNHQDTSSEKTGKNQDNAKAKPAEKTAASQKTVKRKADGGPRRYDGAKESAPSSDRTIASDASDDEEESFDPTTFVSSTGLHIHFRSPRSTFKPI